MGYKMTWANAIAIDKSKAKREGETGVTSLFTYGASDSVEDAKKIIRGWSEDYILLVSWLTYGFESKEEDVVIYDKNIQNLEYGSVENAFERRTILGEENVEVDDQNETDKSVD